MQSLPLLPIRGRGSALRADGSRAIVVFEDRVGAPSLKWLRPGFRHCFCLVRRTSGWIVCDPLKSSTRLEVIDSYEEDELVAHYRAMHMKALVGYCLTTDQTSSIIRPMTCVEVVKRVIGLHAPTVWTPHQLYRALCRVGFVEPSGEGA